MTIKHAGELAGRAVIQIFRAERDDLTAISPLVAGFLRENRGEVIVSLHRLAQGTTMADLLAPPPRGWRRRLGDMRHRLHLAPPSPWGELLTEAREASALMPGNEALDCQVPPGVIRRGDLLALHIRAPGAEVGAAPTAWLSDGPERIQGHLACTVAGEAQGEFGVRATILAGGLIADTPIPRMLCYSPVTQCNLNCIHCISRETRAAKHIVSADIKAQIRQWCAEGKVDYITTDYSGDIIWADYRFGGELDFLIGLNVPFHIDTNGTHLTPAVAERLCASRMQSINFSLDAAEDATYRRIRKGAPPLQSVIHNIEGLMRARTAAGANFQVSLGFTWMRSNIAEWLDFIRLAARLGATMVYGRHVEAYTADMEADSLWHDPEAYNRVHEPAIELARELGIQIAIGNPFTKQHREGRRPCPIPWSGNIILGNGDVAACCVPGLVMGNLGENTMEEIWNGPAYQNLRATVNSANPPIPCQACPLYRHTGSRDSYLIHSALQRLRADKVN